jgi:nucleoside-diphosphate-sugar epimerase
MAGLAWTTKEIKMTSDGTPWRPMVHGLDIARAIIAVLDNRSYRVSFEKIRKHLPGFRCGWDVRRGAQQLHDLFERIDMTKDVVEYRTFMRLKQLEYLIRTQQIDRQFFWTNDDRRST